MDKHLENHQSSFKSENGNCNWTNVAFDIQFGEVWNALCMSCPLSVRTVFARHAAPLREH